MRPLVLILVALVLSGCSAHPDVADTFEIEPDQYAVTFDITREVLRRYRFEPDRLDARAGVITSTSKPTSGLATPWDLEQSSLTDELADLGNQQQRRVRVTFNPLDADDGQLGLGDPVPDVRVAEGPIEVQVQVYVERVRWPGWRLNSAKINLTSRYIDPELRARGMQPWYEQTLHRDDAFARRLSAAIQSRLE